VALGFSAGTAMLSVVEAAIHRVTPKASQVQKK